MNYSLISGCMCANKTQKSNKREDYQKSQTEAQSAFLCLYGSLNPVYIFFLVYCHNNNLFSRA